MKIIRNGQEFELTPKELQQAYEEQHREYFGIDVCDSLQENYNIDPNRGDIDWEEIANRPLACSLLDHVSVH